MLQPSCEWSDIAPEQHIPAGLEIRMDLQTGLKQARLKCASGDADAAQLQLVDEAERDDAVSFDDRLAAMTALLAQLSKMEERSQDAGVLNDALAVLAGLCDADEALVASGGDALALSMLAELTEIVHDREHAMGLAARDGLRLLTSCLAASHVSAPIRAAAARAIGTALQNNAEVQDAAASRTDLPGVLVRVLGASGAARDEMLQRRAVFALGTLVRGHPAVQVRLRESGVEKALRTLAADAAAQCGAAAQAQWACSLATQLTTLFADVASECDAPAALEGSCVPTWPENAGA